MMFVDFFICDEEVQKEEHQKYELW